MKLLDQYIKYKKKYSDCLIIVTSGLFCYTYKEDAWIMNYIFDYQIINQRVGFPSKCLEKIKNVLKNQNISFVILDQEEFEICTIDDSAYYEKLKQAKEIFSFNNNVNDLIDDINYKILIDSNNYNKIRDFVNGL